jgi:hypothetical protein
VTLLPDAPVPLPPPELTAQAGPWGGPTFAYRGARIECMAGAHVCGLFLAEHPLDGQTFGTVQTIKPLVDLWLDDGRLPAHLRAVP